MHLRTGQLEGAQKQTENQWEGSRMLCHRSQKMCPGNNPLPQVRDRSLWINTPSSSPYTGTVSQGFPVDWAPLAQGGDLLINSAWIDIWPLSLPCLTFPNAYSVSWDLLWGDPQTKPKPQMHSASIIILLFPLLHTCLGQAKARAHKAPATDPGISSNTSNAIFPCHITHSPASSGHSLNVMSHWARVVTSTKKWGGKKGRKEKEKEKEGREGGKEEDPQDTPLLRK